LTLEGKDTLETAFPPTGCQLCHNSSAGGDALRAFGNLMVENYGLSPSLAAEEDSTLRSALTELQADNPEAVKDLKAGVNPNDDSVVFANALPQAQYGCSTGTEPRGRAGSAWAPGLLLFAAAAGIRRGRARRTNSR
jgi:hypothetical protein